MRTWHLLTGEYPPACGGVGDYTAALAEALAEAGDVVHVWAPAGATEPDSRVCLHRLPDVFGPATRAALAAAFERMPGTVLLEYVPNALGARGGNLAFCRWFARLRRRVVDVRVMFHEPYFYFRWAKPWAASNGLAVVQRLMARRLLEGASRVYFSTETWSRYLRAPHARALPIPSSLPIAGSASAIARLRDAALRDGTGPLVGHFGTYGAHVAGELEALLPALVSRLPAIRIALIGAGSGAFLDRLAQMAPSLAGRFWASDRLDAADVAAALRACDLLVQPYPDGITTRRTSVMAGLKNGVATLSTAGPLTEAVWRDTDAVALAPAGDVAAIVDRVEALLGDDAERAALAERGEATYAARFSMQHTVVVLRDGPAA